MPAGNAYAVGSGLVGKAFATRRRTITLTDGVATASEELLCAGMPKLYYWILQSSAVAGSTVQPQFMVRAGTGVAVPVDEWLNLQPAQVLAPGIELIIREEFPAVKTRLLFTRDPSVATSVVIEYILACSG